MFIPYGVNPEAYKLAQERMYGLNKQRDILMRLISQVDAELKENIEDGRKLLSEYPTLSLRARSKANPPYTSDDPPPAQPGERACPQCGARVQGCVEGEYCSSTTCNYAL